jgi:hypothetical protein
VTRKKESTVPETEYLLLWVDPRDGIATDDIKSAGGGWVFRRWDGEIHDGPWNTSLRQDAGLDALTRWASDHLGRPVTAHLASRPRRLVPYRFRGCGDTTIYHVEPA